MFFNHIFCIQSDEASSIVDASEEQQLELALAASLREAAASSAAATAALSKRPDSDLEEEDDDDDDDDDEDKDASLSPGSSPLMPTDASTEIDTNGMYGTNSSPSGIWKSMFGLFMSVL